MRTIVDIPDSQVKILDQVSKKKNVSRASLIREALTKYINSYSNSKKSYELAFGVWKRKKLDSLDYQQKLRNEWDSCKLYLILIYC